AREPQRGVLANDGFKVVRCSEATHPPLHIDDRAKRAVEGAAPAQINAAIMFVRAARQLGLQEGQWLRAQIRQLIDEIIKPRKLTFVSIPQDLIKAMVLGFAGKHADT